MKCSACGKPISKSFSKLETICSERCMTAFNRRLFDVWATPPLREKIVSEIPDFWVGFVPPTTNKTTTQNS